jgi:hypothetical protein
VGTLGASLQNYPMREISNLDLKVQLTNEYLRAGGLEKIFDVVLLKDLENVVFDKDGKALPETITPRLNAFMLAILHSNTLPPLVSENDVIEYTSFIQKSTCFDQIKIETTQQVDELIAKFNGSNDILFRGQRESRWRLYSTLQRFWIWDNLPKVGLNYLTLLQNLIANGKAKYEDEITQVLTELHTDSLNDISILGFLQHHGCPTPLLDWTYNFENALFFGVDKLERNNEVREIDKYFSVYYINESDFDAGGMRTLLQSSLQDTGTKLKNGLIAKLAKDEAQRVEMENHYNNNSFFDSNKIKGAGLILHMTDMMRMTNIPISYFSDKDLDSGIAFSLTNSQNIKKQNGVFTWNADAHKPLEVVGNEQYHKGKLESEPDDYRFCECYNINKDLAGYITEKLKQLNLTSETMYPDNKIDCRHVYEESKKAST